MPTITIRVNYNKNDQAKTAAELENAAHIITLLSAKGAFPGVTGTVTPSPTKEETKPAGRKKAEPEKDSAGVPYDKRIHHDKKEKYGNGGWKRKRGVDDALYAAVMAEITGEPLIGGGPGLPQEPGMDFGTFVSHMTTHGIPPEEIEDAAKRLDENLTLQSLPTASPAVIKALFDSLEVE